MKSYLNVALTPHGPSFTIDVYADGEHTSIFLFFSLRLIKKKGIIALCLDYATKRAELDAPLFTPSIRMSCVFYISRCGVYLEDCVRILEVAKVGKHVVYPIDKRFNRWCNHVH